MTGGRRAAGTGGGGGRGTNAGARHCARTPASVSGWSGDLHARVSNAVTASTLSLIVAAAALSTGAPLAAERYPARTVGAWLVAASKDGAGCLLTRDYDGPGATTLLLALDADGSNRLSLLNDHWSIKPASRVALDFRLTGGRYARHAAIGIAAKGKQGFVTNFEWRFPGYFAASNLLSVDRGKIPVARLDLDGAAAAVAELRRCVNGRTGRGARKSRTDIPDDPFALD